MARHNTWHVFSVVLVSLLLLCMKPSELPAHAVLMVSPTASKTGQIAYSEITASTIWLIGGDGASKPVVLGNIRIGPVEYLTWSPDGNRIAFSAVPSASSPGAPFQILVIDADGSNLTQLTHNTFSSFAPRWSPDGTWIAFSGRDEKHGTIYVMSTDGSNLRELFSVELDALTSGFSTAAWSPDGNKIAFISPHEQGWDDNEKRFYEQNIYVLDVKAALELGSKQSLINATKPMRDCETGMYIWSATWAKSGDRLAFSATCAGEEGANIYIVDVKAIIDGKQTAPYRNLTQNKIVAGEYGIDWSPEGTKIVFAGYSDLKFERREIWLLDVTTTLSAEKPTITRLTPATEFDRSYSWPAWRPDPKARPQLTPTKTSLPTVRPK